MFKQHWLTGGMGCNSSLKSAMHTTREFLDFNIVQSAICSLGPPSLHSRVSSIRLSTLRPVLPIQMYSYVGVCIGRRSFPYSVSAGGEGREVYGQLVRNSSTQEKVRVRQRVKYRNIKINFLFLPNMKKVNAPMPGNLMSYNLLYSPLLNSLFLLNYYCIGSPFST